MKTIWIFVFGVLALLIGVACGGDNDDTESEIEDEPTAAEQTDAANDDEDEPTETAGDDDDGSDGDDDGDSTNGDVDACSLLTAEEVSSALGVEMGDGAVGSATYAGFAGCDWNPTDMPTSLVHIEVAVRDRARNEGTYDTWADYQQTEDVSGIGDEAQWDELTNQLDVLEGDAYLIVQAIAGLGAQSDSRTVAEQLAPIALERLP